MLYRLLTNDIYPSHNRIFWFDLRRTPRFRSEEGFKKYTYGVLMSMVLGVVAYWLAERAGFGFRRMPNGFSSILPTWLFFISLPVMLLSSAYTVFVTIILLNQQHHASYWEILLLTPQSEAHILFAKIAAAQISAWRIVVVEAGLRLALLIVVFLNFTTDTISTSGYQRLSGGLFLFVIITGVMGVFLAFEPFLRMRALVALCAMIAVKVGNFYFALLCGFSMVLLYLAVQGFLVFVVGWVIAEIQTSSNTEDVMFGLWCGYPLFVNFILGIVYFVYFRLRQFAFDYNQWLKLRLD